MKNMKIIIIFIVPAILLILNVQTQAQYIIKVSVMGNGGTALSSGSHRIVGTVGQSVIGMASSALNVHEAGFWYLTGNIITNIEQFSDPLPKEFKLYNNYPNPFNPNTTISYSIPQPGLVIVNIYDLIGRKVQTLVNEYHKAGKYSIHYDAGHLPSGVYFYQLQAESGFSDINKFLLVK